MQVLNPISTWNARLDAMANGSFDYTSKALILSHYAARNLPLAAKIYPLNTR